MKRMTAARGRQRRQYRRLREDQELQTGSPWDVPGVSATPSAIILDRDYIALKSASHRMVTRNEGKDKVTFDQACLDVHLGEAARRLAANRSEEEVVPIDGKFRIAAGDVLSIESEEDFRLPADVQGQVSPKAKLTTLGLFFPTTHVDPGFTGHLFLPIINAGPRAVLLPAGEAVGKVELQRLASDVQDPWKGSSGFGNFRDDWVVDGPSVADDREAVRAKIRLLQAWCIALTVSVLTLMVAPEPSRL